MRRRYVPLDAVAHERARAPMIAVLRAEACASRLEKAQLRESSVFELCDWMDTLARKIGVGLFHEVRSGIMHAFTRDDAGHRMEVY